MNTITLERKTVCQYPQIAALGKVITSCRCCSIVLREIVLGWQDKSEAWGCSKYVYPACTDLILMPHKGAMVSLGTALNSAGSVCVLEASEGSRGSFYTSESYGLSGVFNKHWRDGKGWTFVFIKSWSNQILEDKIPSRPTNTFNSNWFLYCFSSTSSGGFRVVASTTRCWNENLASITFD